MKISECSQVFPYTRPYWSEIKTFSRFERSCTLIFNKLLTWNFSGENEPIHQEILQSDKVNGLQKEWRVDKIDVFWLIVDLMPDILGFFTKRLVLWMTRSQTILEHFKWLWQIETNLNMRDQLNSKLPKLHY